MLKRFSSNILEEEIMRIKAICAIMAVIALSLSSGGAQAFDEIEKAEFSFYAALAGSTMRQDSNSESVGMRAGLGASAGLYLMKELELEGGFTWYLVEGSYDNLAGYRWYVNSNPLYFNVVGHFELDRDSEVYLGGGLNMSFWSLHSETGGHEVSVNPGIGHQLFVGLRAEYLFIEAGLMNTVGTVQDESFDRLELNDTYFSFGIAISEL